MVFERNTMPKIQYRVANTNKKHSCETYVSISQPVLIETRETTPLWCPNMADHREQSDSGRGCSNINPTMEHYPGSILVVHWSLPTINLTTATGEKSKMEKTEPLTLFSPPTPAEARRLAKQHAAFGPLGSKQHLYSSRFVGDDFPEPIEDEPPYFYLITTYISYLILTEYVVMNHGTLRLSTWLLG